MSGPCAANGANTGSSRGPSRTIAGRERSDEHAHRIISSNPGARVPVSTGDALLVLCTCPDEAVARDLARRVVEARLAACVNILPSVRSIYTWQGEIADDAEALMLVKTRDECFERLQQTIVDAHPYDVPEVVGIDIERGFEPYLSWITDTTA